MSAPATNTTLLRLHVASDGQVWYGHDRCFASGSDMGAEDFLRSHEHFGFSLEGVQQVRLLGVPSNAELIVELHQRRRRKPKLYAGQQITLASPAVCPSAACRADPLQVMQHLWQPSTSGFTSGFWHQLGELEFPTYALINSLAKCPGPKLDDLSSRLLHYHPAWPALSFLPTVDTYQAAQVVTTIVDPRWFRDLCHPDRLSRLFEFMGLTPGNVRAFVDGLHVGRHYHRFRSVLDSWSVRQEEIITSNDPRNFLWRILRCHTATPRRGLLRACQCFIRFVRFVWLHELGSREPEAVFIPGSFFRRPEEIRAYIEHRETLKRE